jgi:hypothetical protein
MSKLLVPVLALVSTTIATSAFAQSRFEGAVGYWLPRSSIVVAADAAGVSGTAVDLRQDAGLTDGAFPTFAVSFRAAARHRIRFEFLPISFDSTSTLPRGVVFNGIAYPRGTSISSRFDWTTVRLGYEYDFLVRPRWTAGLVVEARQTVIQERLVGGGADQSRRSQVPVPAAGGAVMLRASGRASIRGEIVGIKVPNRADRHYGGHYVDLTLVGTYDFATHVGVQAGYRLVDIGHLGETDSATLTVRGFYVGAVVRR